MIILILKTFLSLFNINLILNLKDKIIKINMVIVIKSSYSVLLFILSVVMAMPFIKFNFLFNLFVKDSFKTESSVWCLKSSDSNTFICRFKNVCYDSHLRSILFFLGSESTIKGFTHYTELQKIQLSSIYSHNQFYANLSIINAENYEIKKQINVEEKAFLFSRFKPNNIMHVIHDDILPLFLTLELICLGDRSCIESYKLLMHDYQPEGTFFNLYKLFSNHQPILLNSLPSSLDYILCFKEMSMGLLQDSIFYQYGFKKPHGPVKSSKVTENDISRFSSFVKEKFQVNNNGVLKSDIVLISRTKSRKILNLEEVKNMIKDSYHIAFNKNNARLVVLDLNSNNTSTLLSAISKTDILIGMHGAEMIFSLFMKPRSIVVELFPFGIIPEVVSFIKPVSEIDGSNLHYFSWRNMFKNNSVFHTNAHPLLGGISHLNQTVQNKIKNIDQVPPVECCNNPVYLHYMYQDTWVSNDFGNFLKESIAKYLKAITKQEIRQTVNKWFYPDTVVNVSCEFQGHKKRLILNWYPPNNTKAVKNLTYSVYLKSKINNFEKDFLTVATSLDVEIPGEFENNPGFQIWILVHFGINNSSSPDFYFECN